MHGRKRNAEEYRDQWLQASQDLNLFVIVPEFSEQNFQAVWGFNYGNIKTKNLEGIQKELHTFMGIEPRASHALEKFKINSKSWGMYGHGAGAKCLKRVVLRHQEASYKRAIPATLRWSSSMTEQEGPCG